MTTLTFCVVCAMIPGGTFRTERGLLNAQAEVQATRAEVDGARQDAAVAASAMGDAERAVTAARARVVDRTEG